MRTPRSGTQHLLRAGAYAAAISSVGASLRVLTHSDRDLVVPFDADEVRPAYRGVTLAPWPNRIVDGRYELNGMTHELALTEPARAHALHGLAVWLDYEPVDKGTSHVRLGADIVPQAGYPWRVRVETEYTLTEAGLVQEVVATNHDTQPIPWGTGPHPYLVAGPSALDEWVLELPAGRVLEVREPRLSPTELVCVSTDATRFDFRAARPIGSARIDHAFSELSRDGEGLTSVTVRDPSGGGVAMRWDASCPWVQVHTADLPPAPGGGEAPGNRRGLAVEPMTCAPDAFNAGRYPFDTGLQLLAPGESARATWTIFAL